MPRGRRTQAHAATPDGALERMVFEIGQRLGEALRAGVQASAAYQRPAGARGPGRPPSATGASCRAPHCSRRAVAKGLCATHYRKARRLGLGDALSAAQLNELARDGRKSRSGNEAA